jgi:hypothetical protein
MTDITTINLNPTFEQFQLEGQNAILKKNNHFMVVMSIILTGVTSAAIYYYYKKERNFIQQSPIKI